MFKKTLLALAVAGVSLSATAGTLVVDAKTGGDTVLGAAVFDFDGDVNGCEDAADALGVVSGGVVPNPAANHAITFINAGIYTTTSSVTYTADDACEVVVPTELVDAEEAKYSLEGATAKGVTIEATQIAGIGGYTEEDTITFTVTGGDVNEDASLGAKLESYGGNGDFTLLGVVGNKILFTVNQGYTGAARELLRLTDVVVTPDADVSEIKVASEVQNTANVKYDETDSVTLANLAKQYSATVYVKADGVIDVQTERLNFEENANDAAKTFLGDDKDTTTSDTIVVKVTKNVELGELTPAAGSLVIEGNFTWLQDFVNVGGVVSPDAYTYSSHKSLELSGEKADDGDDEVTIVTLNDDMDELTVLLSVEDDQVDTYHSFTFDVLGEDADPAPTAELAETPFSVSVNFYNDPAEDATAGIVDLPAVSDEDAGQWVLNGSVVNVPYIPFGPQTEPVIRHTNKGTQTGDISLRYMVEGSSGNVETNEWKSLGVIVEDAKPGVRDLLAVITEKLTTELGTNKFKVALEITTNVPKEDVTVFAAAKITAEGQDRISIGAFSSPVTPMVINNTTINNVMP